MANRKKPLGKVVAQLQGYRVRHIVEKNNVGVKRNTGKFGIYAGKNLVSGNEEFKNKEEAVKFLEEYLDN